MEGFSRLRHLSADSVVCLLRKIRLALLLLLRIWPWVQYFQIHGLIFRFMALYVKNLSHTSYFKTSPPWLLPGGHYSSQALCYTAHLAPPCSLSVSHLNSVPQLSLFLLGEFGEGSEFLSGEPFIFVPPSSPPHSPLLCIAPELLWCL